MRCIRTAFFVLILVLVLALLAACGGPAVALTAGPPHEPTEASAPTLAVFLVAQPTTCDWSVTVVLGGFIGSYTRRVSPTELEVSHNSPVQLEAELILPPGRHTLSLVANGQSTSRQLTLQDPCR